MHVRETGGLDDRSGRAVRTRLLTTGLIWRGIRARRRRRTRGYRIRKLVVMTRSDYQVLVIIVPVVAVAVRVTRVPIRARARSHVDVPPGGVRVLVDQEGHARKNRDAEEEKAQESRAKPTRSSLPPSMFRAGPHVEGILYRIRAGPVEQSSFRVLWIGPLAARVRRWGT